MQTSVFSYRCAKCNTNYRLSEQTNTIFLSYGVNTKWMDGITRACADTTHTYTYTRTHTNTHTHTQTHAHSHTHAHTHTHTHTIPSTCGLHGIKSHEVRRVKVNNPNANNSHDHTCRCSYQSHPENKRRTESEYALITIVL